MSALVRRLVRELTRLEYTADRRLGYGTRRCEACGQVGYLDCWRALRHYAPFGRPQFQVGTVRLWLCTRCNDNAFVHRTGLFVRAMIFIDLALVAGALGWAAVTTGESLTFYIGLGALALTGAVAAGVWTWQLLREREADVSVAPGKTCRDCKAPLVDGRCKRCDLEAYPVVERPRSYADIVVGSLLLIVTVVALML